MRGQRSGPERREGTFVDVANVGHSPSHADDAKVLARLSPLALAHWPTVARQMRDAGVLDSVDAASLVGYCEAFARWCAAGEELSKMLIELGLTASRPTQVPSSVSANSPSSANVPSERTAPSVSRAPNAIMRCPDVQSATGLSHSTIYLRVKAGTFPAPVKLGERSVGWRVADIEAFLSAPAEYRPAQKST